MKRRKIRKVIETTVEAVLIILSFGALFYLASSLGWYFQKDGPDFQPNYTFTINKFIFLCVFIGLVAWISILLSEKKILKTELLFELRGDLLIKSEYAKAGVSSKYNREIEEDTLVDILGLLSYKEEPLETVEDIDNLLKEFKSPRKRGGIRIGK